MTGPSGRVKAIRVVASPGHLLISSLWRCLRLTGAAGTPEHTVSVQFSVFPVFWQQGSPGGQILDLSAFHVAGTVLISAEGSFQELVLSTSPD